MKFRSEMTVRGHFRRLKKIFAHFENILENAIISIYRVEYCYWTASKTRYLLDIKK